MGVSNESVSAASREALRLAYVTACRDGGVANHVLLMARSMSEHGAEVVVIGPHDGWLRERIIASTGAEYVGLPLTSKLSVLNDLCLLPKLRRLIQQGRFDIVHSHSAKACVLVALAVPRSASTRLVYTANCTIKHYVECNRLARYVYPIECWAARRHDFLIATCNKEHREFLTSRMGNEDSITTIHNSIDYKQVSKRNGYYRFRAGVDNCHFPVIGTCCRFHPQKRLDHLLLSIHRVLQDFPNARFLLAGNGPQEFYLKHMVSQLGLTEYVRFVGFVDDSYSFLPDLDAFVHTSGWEAFPYAVIEAGMAGLPVVATAAGGVSDLIDATTGWLVEVGNIDGISAALIQCLTDRDEARSRAKRLCKKVSEQFSLATASRETLAIYRKLQQSAKFE